MAVRLNIKMLGGLAVGTRGRCLYPKYSGAHGSFHQHRQGPSLCIGFCQMHRIPPRRVGEVSVSIARRGNLIK